MIGRLRYFYCKPLILCKSPFFHYTVLKSFPQFSLGLFFRKRCYLHRFILSLFTSLSFIFLLTLHNVPQHPFQHFQDSAIFFNYYLLKFIFISLFHLFLSHQASLHSWNINSWDFKILYNSHKIHLFFVFFLQFSIKPRCTVLPQTISNHITISSHLCYPKLL